MYIFNIFQNLNTEYVNCKLNLIYSSETTFYISSWTKTQKKSDACNKYFGEDF